MESDPLDAVRLSDTLEAELIAALGDYQDGHAAVCAGSGYGHVHLPLCGGRHAVYAGQAHPGEDVWVVGNAEAAHQNRRMMMATSRP